MYGSSNYYDEMGLAKAWMAKATGDPADLEAAKSIYDQYASNLDYNSAWINWDDKTPAFVAMMCELTGESKHCNQLKSWYEKKILSSSYDLLKWKWCCLLGVTERSTGHLTRPREKYSSTNGAA